MRTEKTAAKLLGSAIKRDEQTPSAGRTFRYGTGRDPDSLLLSRQPVGFAGKSDSDLQSDTEPILILVFR